MTGPDTPQLRRSKPAFEVGSTVLRDIRCEDLSLVIAYRVRGSTVLSLASLIIFPCPSKSADTLCRPEMATGVRGRSRWLDQGNVVSESY